MLAVRLFFCHFQKEKAKLKIVMSRRCQVTGRTPGFGNRVSHSHRKTRRRWNPNLQWHTFWVPSEKRNVRLLVSAKGLKAINRDGIEKILARIRARGERV